MWRAELPELFEIPVRVRTDEVTPYILVGSSSERRRDFASLRRSQLSATLITKIGIVLILLLALAARFHGSESTIMPGDAPEGRFNVRWFIHLLSPAFLC
jgi:hypothetical protein